MEALLMQEPCDVFRVIQQIEKAKVEKHKSQSWLEMLQSIINVARLRVLANEVVDWETLFLQAGFVTSEILTDHRFNRMTFAKFLLKKHKAYGVKPLEVWKELGILVRLTSKVGRIENIKGDDAIDLGDESMQDTLKDSLGYCILGYLLTQRLAE